MNGILVDTSVWIDALNGKQTKQTKILSKSIEDDIPIFTCPIVIQEILQGIKSDKDFKNVKEALTGFELLYLDPLEAAYGSATLYRSIRKAGITIRKSNDCLIAYYCISHKLALLHNDEDFYRISKHSQLKVFS